MTQFAQRGVEKEGIIVKNLHKSRGLGCKGLATLKMTPRADKGGGVARVLQPSNSLEASKINGSNYEPFKFCLKLLKRGLAEFWEPESYLFFCCLGGIRGVNQVFYGSIFAVTLVVGFLMIT